MILCFGTFAKILNLCNRDLPQEKFVPRIAWAVDRQNSSLASGLDYSVDDPDGMEGNKSVISRLLSCERPLVLREKELPTSEVACERFKDKVTPYIDDLKVTNAVLATLYIISEDEVIAGERRECFKKYLGMPRDELLQQTTFNVPDFFARVLLYTTCVDNNEGRPYAKEISDAFIAKAVKKSWSEIKWDATTQTVEVIPTEGKRIWDEIQMVSELRRSLLENQVDYADMGWLDVDEKVLFPSRHVEFGDPETKRIASDKMVQYIKLVHEFVDCLAAKQQSASGQVTGWPLFPDERMRDIRHQLDDLSSKLLFLGTFGDHFSSKQEQAMPGTE